MPLSANSQILIQTLEALPELNGRFRNLRLVNYDSANDEKRGCFSLVFRGDDTLGGKPVAIKFYDIAPHLTRDRYRRAAFAREAEILQQLTHTDRCLQLVQPISVFNLHFPTATARTVPAGLVATIPCEYFVIEWLDEDIDRYFLAHEDIDSLEKLYLFNDIVLAVEALHRRKIFHRDLKADNFRIQTVGGKWIAVAIDLGTAARFDSGLILMDYAGPVGAIAYAASEASCGVSGNRVLAPYTDIYSLGCLLFELFNASYFYVELLARNPHLDLRHSGIALGIPKGATKMEQIDALNRGLSVYARGVTAIRIDAPGSTVDPAICLVLNGLLESMTHFDYRKRPSLSLVRERIGIAIKILSNEALYQRRLAQNREWRRRRLKKLRLAQGRLQLRLGIKETGSA